MLEGKNIRTLSNGMDNFDDYWTDSSKIMDTSSSFYVLSFHVICNKTIHTGYSHGFFFVFMLSSRLIREEYYFTE